MTAPLLSVRGLRVEFAVTGKRTLVAVDGVDLDVHPGETVGIVGESGSGKSVTALALMGLLPRPPARIPAGSVSFDGRDLLTLPEREMRRIRGAAISMIFQEPMTSLNPVFTVGDQLEETFKVHERFGAVERRKRAVALLEKVGIAAAARRINDYPHQLSGGMRQRVMIAMAIACNPKLLIADEPTTALDVTIQAQILDLLAGLRREFGMAIMIITHNMGVVAEVADRVLVMYAGRMAELAPVEDLFERPRHPYTRGLLHSIPRIDDERDRLTTIPGTLPDPVDPPPGCRFAPRCGLVQPACIAAAPPFADLGGGRFSGCIRHSELAS